MSITRTLQSTDKIQRLRGGQEGEQMRSQTFEKKRSGREQAVLSISDNQNRGNRMKRTIKKYLQVNRLKLMN